MFNMKEKKMRERKGGRQSRGMVKVAISLDDKRIDLLHETADAWSEIPSVMLRVILHYAMEAGDSEFITYNPGCQMSKVKPTAFWVDRKLVHYLDNISVKTGLSKARITRAMFDYYMLEETRAEERGGDIWDVFENKVADLLYNDKAGEYNES